MEMFDHHESFLQWDRNLSEASEPGEPEQILYPTHFTDLLDELSEEALLGQLLSDPFLTGRCDLLDGDLELRSASPPPHIQSEHSYSLSGESRPQSPLSHLPPENTDPEADDDDDDDEEEGWRMEVVEEVEKHSVAAELSDSPGLISAFSLTLSTKSMTTDHLTDTPPQQISAPQIKLEPHEVDQFLNLSPKELEVLQLPPTPPSSHGSDSEGSHSPVYPCAPASPSPNPEPPSEPTNLLSDSPLLTAPHKLQGSGPLLLTEEERRTLVAEGYPVPTKLPLSKSEEKALKKIRRKIKNKISAQESRRKKKEYMDALERKVKTCSNENTELRKKVETLENTNKSLLLQLHSLQSIVTGKVPRSCKITSTQTSTCLMVVVLCFALFLGHFYQNINPCSSNTNTHPSEGRVLQTYTSTVKSRSLLTVENDGADEDPRPYGLGGAYPEWDGQNNAMWRLEHRGEALEESAHSASQPPVSPKNSTEIQHPHLSELHTAGSLQQPLAPRPKVIEIERTVNKKS